MNDDALIMVQLRNDFYKGKARLALAVFFLCLLCIVMLVSMLVYLIKHPSSPRYFVTDDAGRFILDIPIQQPNMTTEEVTAWVVEAVQAAYSYDYVNYRAQLQNAQKYFTDFGWYSYMKGLQASNNLLALANRKQVVIAKVVGAPQLIGEHPIGKEGIYAYKFQIQLLVTYLKAPAYDEKTKFLNPLIITAVVQRQNVLSSYKGLGIAQLVGQLAQSTSAEMSSTPP
jgi:intracellular multiplication protein IcmL